MERNNIFKLLEQNYKSFESNLFRIDELFQKRYMIEQNFRQKTTLKNFVQQHCFYSWKNRGRCIDVDDFLNTIGYPLDPYETINLYSYLDRIEGIYNLWYLAKNYRYLSEKPPKFYITYSILKTLLDDCLSDFNYKAYYNSEVEQLIVAEDKPEVTAVAEIVDPQTAFEIVRYNHRTLQGNFEAKKRILLTMGAELEPKRNVLKGINQSLERNIFFMLNNLNLRHNNCAEGDKNYKKAVASMTPMDLEHWYDVLYQMILLANLELENSKRLHDIDSLKNTLSRENL